MAGSFCYSAPWMEHITCFPFRQYHNFGNSTVMLRRGLEARPTDSQAPKLPSVRLAPIRPCAALAVGFAKLPCCCKLEFPSVCKRVFCVEPESGFGGSRSKLSNRQAPSPRFQTVAETNDQQRSARLISSRFDLPWQMRDDQNSLQVRNPSFVRQRNFAFEKDDKIRNLAEGKRIHLELRGTAKKKGGVPVQRG